MRLKALANHNRVVRLEDWNGLDLTGGNDCSSILNSAHTQGAADGAPIITPAVAPGGGILVGTTVAYKAPMIGPTFAYQTAARTVFKPGMSDGSAVFSALVVDSFHIENIAVDGVVGAGPGYSKTNCTAFKFGDTTWTQADGVVEVAGSPRGYMRNVSAYGVAKGFSMLGWIPRYDNIYARFCGLGFEGKFLNAGDMSLVVEGCGVGFEISDCNALTITRLLDEGNAEYRTGPSRIDSSFDVTIVQYYAEGTPAAYPWLVLGGRESNTRAGSITPVMKGYVASSSYLAAIVGPTTGDTWYSRLDEYMYQWNGSTWVPLGKGGCRDVRVLSGVVGAVTGSAPIVVDYSSRHSINVLNKDYEAVGPAYQETANARADMSEVLRSHNCPPATTAAAGGLNKVAYYLNPNPLMNGKRFGCDTSGLIRATVTEEATISRNGLPGIRITAAAGAGGNNIYRLYFCDPWVARIAARGTGFTVGAWCWIPDVAGMGYGDTGTTYYPGLSVWTIDAGANADTAVSTVQRKRGAWNFLHIYQIPQTDATELRVTLAANLSSTEAPGDSSVYIVVDEMYIAEGDCWERMAAGQVQRSNECTGHIDGGIMTIRLPASRATTMIANATQSFKQGDTIEYTDTAASGNKGITCTTPGAGGTAVFKAFGVIAA